MRVCLFIFEIHIVKGYESMFVQVWGSRSECRECAQKSSVEGGGCD